VVLLGNNLGLLASPRRGRSVLRALARVTAPGGQVIAGGLDPYDTAEPLHFAYHRSNRERGRMAGQIRMRARHKAMIGAWFDYLFLSRPGLAELVDGTGWCVSRFIGAGAGYVALLDKVAAWSFCSAHNNRTPCAPSSSTRPRFRSPRFRSPGSSPSRVRAAHGHSLLSPRATPRRPRGWIVAGDRYTPMPAALLASERDEFYLYDVMRLVPLRDAAVTLTPIASDTLGQAGFRAAQPGRPAVDVHVTADGRLAHLRTQVQDPAGGAPVWRDVWLSGVLEAGGVRWPRELRLTMSGAPYFALTARGLAVRERLDDERLRGPR